MKLFVGPVLAGLGEHPPWVVFGLEFRSGDGIEVAVEDDMPSRLFHESSALACVHGTSNADSVYITLYRHGRVVQEHDTLMYDDVTRQLIWQLGFDVPAFVDLAGFGVSPPELPGTEHPIEGPLDIASMGAVPDPLPMPGPEDRKLARHLTLQEYVKTAEGAYLPGFTRRRWGRTRNAQSSRTVK